MNQLVDIMKILRSPKGCAWDRKQTIASLMTCMLEETHEVLDATTLKQYDKLREELGDLLCIIAMITVIAEERGLFNKNDIMRGAARKMKQRHPHVFGDKRARTAEDAHALWNAAKKAEVSFQKRKHIFDDLSPHFPALLRSQKIYKRLKRNELDAASERALLAGIRAGLNALAPATVDKKKRNTKKTEALYSRIIFDFLRLGVSLSFAPEALLQEYNTQVIDRFIKQYERLKKKGKSLEDLTDREKRALLKSLL